jgi:signal transduction histidine kinase
MVEERELQKRLLSVEVETFDEKASQNGADELTGEQIFARFSDEVLEAFQTSFPEITSGWISVAGLEPGQLRVLATMPASLAIRIPRMTRQQASEIAVKGHEIVSFPQSHFLFRASVPTARSALVLRLIGHYEYYGILVLCSANEGYFRGKELDVILDNLVLLNRLMAEANFSMRLTALAAPFDLARGTPSENRMFEEIVRQACHGLGADGAVLRIRESSQEDVSGYTLRVKGQYGLVHEEQTTPGSVGERICRRVFQSPEFVTVQTLLSDGKRLGFGAAISDEDDAELRRLGIQAYLIMKLQLDVEVDEKPTVLGTLAVFHRLPQVFSRRDVSLFQGFCERVADDLALVEQRDENRAISQLLRAQDRLGTRAEITALLGHDFGHRVYHVRAAIDDFIDTCRHALRDHRPPESIMPEAEKLRAKCDELRGIVSQLKVLGQGEDESPSRFNVQDVFQEIERTMNAVLARNNMSLDTRVDGNCSCFGVRGILLQALFNLVINAVDAQKESRKKNVVHLSCREKGADAHRKLEIKVWDEGSGISWVNFPDAKRIFEVGATSKPQGTGTGLPAARSLLFRYFRADLDLVDRSKALFQFSILCSEPSK